MKIEKYFNKYTKKKQMKLNIILIDVNEIYIVRINYKN